MAGPVAKGMAQGGVLLACARELRPYRGHQVIELQVAVIDELEQEQRHEGFAHGVDVDQGVPPPLLHAAGIGPPADQGDHQAVVDEDRHGCADLPLFNEVGGEGVAHRSESLIAAAGNRNVGTCWRSNRRAHGLSAVRKARTSGNAVRSWMKNACPPS